MIDQEWEKVKELFGRRYGQIELDCDGYKITLMIEGIGKMQLAVVAYVSGSIKGATLMNDCEERRRFYQKREKFIFKKKFRDDMKKILGKRLYNAKEYEKKIEHYHFYWKSFNKLKAHLIANNKEIKLIRSI